MDTQPTEGLKLLERIGSGAGYAAGGVALALLWIYEITTSARNAARRKGGRQSPSGMIG